MFSFSPENAVAIRQAYEEGSEAAGRQVEEFGRTPIFQPPDSFPEDFPIAFAVGCTESAVAYSFFSFAFRAESLFGGGICLAVSSTSAISAFYQACFTWEVGKKKIALAYPEQYKNAMGTLSSSAKILEICQNKVFQARPCSTFSSLLGRCRRLVFKPKTD